MSQARIPSRSERNWTLALIVLGFVFGVPVYVAYFLFAYAFADEKILTVIMGIAFTLIYISIFYSAIKRKSILFAGLFLLVSMVPYFKILGIPLISLPF